MVLGFKGIVLNEPLCVQQNRAIDCVLCVFCTASLLVFESSALQQLWLCWLITIYRQGGALVGGVRNTTPNSEKKVFLCKSCTVDWFCIVQRSLILFGDKFREFSRFQNL